ncbi:cytochrome P450 [Ceratobasidium sp. AG-I]|nr:cytochrome P450 [Ceratobasidium sp. AG-I]
MNLDLSTLAEYATLTNALCLAGGLIVLKYHENLWWLVQSRRSPLRHLPGPPNGNLFVGHLLKVNKEETANIHERWFDNYGKMLQFRGFLGSYVLYTADMRAINFIMSRDHTLFPKSERSRKGLARVLGNGLLSAEPEAHKRQRRIMNPSFGVPQIRLLVPVFWEKSNQLRDMWLEQMDNATDGTTVEVLSWLSRATMDIIGTAGFGYEFNSLRDGNEDLLAKAFAKIFDSDKDVNTLTIVKIILCRLFHIPTEDSTRLDNNIETTRRLGKKIVDDKKKQLQASKEGSTPEGRDLLSLLIKSIMALENSEEGTNQGMSEDEVLGQISTFLAAGHETTSTSMSWALYALSKNLKIQEKLRHELQTAGLGDEPQMAELDKLPYLDCVVKEVLRVFPAVPATMRQAAVDATIPVGEEYKDRYGVTQTHVNIQKGDNIYIPIIAMNRSRDVWGEDANDFKPERWDNLPEAAKDMPGVWGHQMTFIHGSHACIGFRFALIEIKVLLYTLIRSIEFGIDPTIEIEGKTSIVTRPCVKSEPNKGNQMPLICKPVARA